MAKLDEAVAAWRKRLLAGESQVIQEITDAYAVAERRIAKALLDLLEILADSGQVSPSALFIEGRLETLLQQVERELTQWGDLAGRYVESGQSTAVAQAAIAAQQYAEAQAPRTLSIPGSWNRLPIEALQRWVGSRGDGSPVRDSLQRFGPVGARIVEEGITSGLALGLNPRDVGRQITRALREEDAMPPGFDETFQSLRELRYNATRTARTEILRSHRGAALDNYRANSDVVKGFMSRSARDRRTCLACWMADGQVYPLGYEATSWHPQCRCAWIPVLEEAGVQPTGPELFLLQSDEVKLEVLGPARFELLEQGKDPRTFVVLQDDRDWGPQRRIIPVGQIEDGDDRSRSTARILRKQIDPPIRDAAPIDPAGDGPLLDIAEGTNQSQFENTIWKFNQEVGTIFTPSGEMMRWPVVGSTGRLDLSKVGDMMPGNTLVHNHPGSGCFSGADIATATRANLKKIVAVCGDGRIYEIERTTDVWPAQIMDVVISARQEAFQTRRKGVLGIPGPDQWSKMVKGKKVLGDSVKFRLRKVQK